MAFTREVNKIIDQVRAAGWRVEARRHWRVYPPDITKKPLTIASSPSDGHAIQNIRADLRRAGLIVKI